MLAGDTSITTEPPQEWDYARWRSWQKGEPGLMQGDSRRSVQLGWQLLGPSAPPPPPLASSSWHPPTPCPLTLLVHSS